MYKVWYYLDNGLNDLANWLKYSHGIKFLAAHCLSDVADSPKDDIIYKEIEEKFSITPFEKKIIDNEAHKDTFIPNSYAILKATSNNDLRKQFIEQTNVNMDCLKWNTEEILKLNAYKNNGMERLYKMLNYYHKQHFLMSIGVKSWEK